MSLAGLAASGLEVLGGFSVDGPDPDLPEGTRTVLLLGPREPGFWPFVSASPEFADGGDDPLDRWSTRVIGDLAADLGAAPLFPFGGPPWRPFIAWAQRCGTIRVSPVGLLVHERAGLWLSVRGALAIPEVMEVPVPGPSPCDGCAAPCLSACPVEAMAGEGYDTAVCHAFLDTSAGSDCMEQGCRVRRACPVSQSYGRMAAQSAFHMRAFHGVS